MPQAVTHILVPIILVALFRDFYIRKGQRQDFPLHYVLLAGIGGVLPDIDIVISFFLSIFTEDWWIHKTFTHSLLFPLSLLALSLIFLPFRSDARVCNIGRHRLRLSTMFLILAIGSSIHIFLDTMLGEASYLLYPISGMNFGIDLLSSLPFDHSLILATIDGILLVLWLGYLELRHRISDFI